MCIPSRYHSLKFIQQPNDNFHQIKSYISENMTNKFCHQRYLYLILRDKQLVILFHKVKNKKKTACHFFQLKKNIHINKCANNLIISTNNQCHHSYDITQIGWKKFCPTYYEAIKHFFPGSIIFNNNVVKMVHKLLIK